MKKSLKSLRQSLSSLSTCVVGPATRHRLENETDGVKSKNGGDKEDPETKLENGEANWDDLKTKLNNREDREDPQTKLKIEGDRKNLETKLKDEEEREDPKTKTENEERVEEGPQRPHYPNFKEQAIEYVKQAVQEDNAGNYAKAFPLYMNALEYFKTHLKYEKNPKIREAITQKFTEYLRRAEEIRAVLDDCIAVHVASGSHARVTATPTTKPKDREGNVEGLHYAIVREKPNVKWSDVAGLESAKQALHESAIMPVRFPHLFTGKRQPWRTFLLYGPPGTGKSYLAKAVATESYSTFFSVLSTDLVSVRVEESEKIVSNLFHMARESKPSVIFIDEIDSLSGPRGKGSGSEAARRIITEILSQMKGVGIHDDKVLVLAATHTPYSIHQDIRRRFDKCIYIPLPDSKARKHIFKVHLGDTPNNLTESDFESLARKTEGFSGSDIDVCVKDVLFEPIRKIQDAMFFVETNEGLWVPCVSQQAGAVQTTMQELAAQGLAEKISPPPITRTDFDKVLARQKPTVSESDLEVHERFAKELG